MKKFVIEIKNAQGGIYVQHVVFADCAEQARTKLQYYLQQLNNMQTWTMITTTAKG
jgi:hypothetical protein